jgi:branched-chain amino acid transport system ATP-binding protein
MNSQAEMPCAELAYGDLKRVELAIALACRPRLLLMDEPTAGMAAAERHLLMTLVRNIAKDDGISVLFTEHDMDIVFQYAGRVIVLSEGELIAQGAPAEVRADPLVRRVYLGEEA